MKEEELGTLSRYGCGWGWGSQSRPAICQPQALGHCTNRGQWSPGLGWREGASRAGASRPSTLQPWAGPHGQASGPVGRAQAGGLSAERGHVRADADAAAEGVGPHHGAAGHGARRRVPRGLQGGGPGSVGGSGRGPGACGVPSQPQPLPRPARCPSASSTWETGPSPSPSRGPSPRCPSGRRSSWPGACASCQTPSGRAPRPPARPGRDGGQ